MACVLFPLHLCRTLVFNEKDNHLYCHHEVLINAYPLALEWLNYDPGQPEEEGK